MYISSSRIARYLQRKWPLHFAVLLLLLAVTAAPQQARAGGLCPVDQFLLQPGTCMVCAYPGTLQPTGATVGPGDAHCYECAAGDSPEPLSCYEYWDEAITPDIFESPRRAGRYQRLALRWAVSIARGHPSPPFGSLLLSRSYRDSLQHRFASQTDALNLIADVAHFGNQLQPSKPWPALNTTVTFTQRNLLGNNGVVLHANSNVGSATLHPGVLGALMLLENGGAWTNLVVRPLQLSPGASARGPIVLEQDWRVRNMFTAFETATELARGEQGVMFDLGVPGGVVVEAAEFVLLQDPEPIPFGLVETQIQDQGGAFDIEFVGEEDFKIGGRKNETGGFALESPDLVNIGFFDGCDVVDIDPGDCDPFPDPDPFYGSVNVPFLDLPQVNEFENFCAPAAVARGLKILFPSLPSPIIIMIGLGEQMGTTTEGGTPTSGIVPGKHAYAAANGLSVTTTETEVADFDNDTDAQIAAKLAAAIDAAIATLEAGGVVEINMTWLGANSSQSEDGHTALVKSIFKKPGGGVQIEFVDDGTQGDNMQENELNTINLDNLGRFWGNKGQVDGFILETTP